MKIKDQQFDEHKIRNFVPFYMRDLICMCSPDDMYGTAFYRDERHIGGAGNLSISRCKECHKYMRFMQRVCILCGDRFVLTFQHPKYWPGYPTCWHCTNRDDYDPWAKHTSIWYKPTTEQEKANAKARRESDRKRRFDNWPIIEPLPEDLVKKEAVTELIVEEIDLEFGNEVLF